MYRLTRRRQEKAQAILNKYRIQLQDEGVVRVEAFEMDLRACWKVGYQELKGIIIDLSKLNPYRYLAAYYMENSNAGIGIVTEFKRHLDHLYGFDRNEGEDQAKKRESFWAGLKKRWFFERICG
jgi:hypothetical protein